MLTILSFGSHCTDIICKSWSSLSFLYVKLLPPATVSLPFLHCWKNASSGVGSALFSPIHHRAGLWKLTWALIKGCAPRVNKTKWLRAASFHILRKRSHRLQKGDAAGNCVFIVIIRRRVCVMDISVPASQLDCCTKSKAKPGHPYLNTQIHNVRRTLGAGLFFIRVAPCLRIRRSLTRGPQESVQLPIWQRNYTQT